jgi:hypothetical protein
MARIKPIFGKRFQPARQAFLRGAGCCTGAGRHSSGKPGRGKAEYHIAARESL